MSNSPWYILKNSEGKPDGMWTMSWYSFLLWMLHALVIGLFGGSSFVLTFPWLAATIVLPTTFEWYSFVALLPVWAGYIFRRHEIFKKNKSRDLADEEEE